jgi:hypothetical protein
MFSQYNLMYIPSCYYDGGDEVRVGGFYGDTAAFASDLRDVSHREVPDLDLDISMTWLGNYQMEVTVTVTNNYFNNQAPDAPGAPTGPVSGLQEDEHLFSAGTTDPNDDDLYYMWDFGDEITDWIGPYASGETVELSHKWDTPGFKSVIVKTKDVWDEETAWSDNATIKVVGRGDANSDMEISVADAVYLIYYIFHHGPGPDPETAGDANCSGDLNIGDAVYLINHVFKGGPPPGCF